MYTQCPECNSAFRVTAEVLKQAAGKVRCGSCSHAFNALEFLSETRPKRIAEHDVEAPIPELTPDFGNAQAGMSEPASAEQSAALLETLDQLAGADVRIEDTGVEWRVLDPDEDSEALAEELFDEPRTPVDEFLTETPTSVDAGEIFDELRFDDDTPLPEDFAVDEPTPEPHDIEPPDGAASVEAGATTEDAAEQDAADDPGGWAEILDEFEDDIAPAERPLDAELAAVEAAETGVDAAEPDGDETGREETAADVDEGSDDAADAETISGDEAAGDDTRNQSIAADDDEGGAAPGTDAETAAANYDRAGGDTDQSDTGNADENDKELESAVRERAGEKLITETDVSPGFESIVMEGEFVSSALDDDKRVADIAAAAALAEQAQQRWDDDHIETTSARLRPTTAGVVTLVLLLLLQVVHQSRESLLKAPALDRILGPVYRAAGQPVSPAWDVTGWRFEATNGSAGEGGERLAINSRVGNKSGVDLPYPLISVTLTDRYEDALGSTVLAPSEYLAGNIDPGAFVRSGDSFHAVISVLSPAEAATGFKLNVCYRLSDTTLRCARDGFR